MARLRKLDPSELNPKQKVLYDRIAGARGAVRGPFNAWLYSPDLCDRVEAFGKYVRFDSEIPMDLKELVVIIAARRWTSQYMWQSHTKVARKEGVSDAVIDAIAAHKRPDFPNEDQRIVYDFAHEMLETGTVGDKTWNDAIGLLGEQRTVELIALIGNFSMVAMALNAFQVDLPEGVAPELT